MPYANVKHHYQVLGVVDLLQHWPVATQPGTVDAGRLGAERLANSPGRYLACGCVRWRAESPSCPALKGLWLKGRRYL